MKYVLIGWAVILVIFFVALSKIPIGIEPLTEIYFEDHANLPKTMSPNESSTFSFTIHNLEYKQMIYPYEITENYQNKSIMIEKGSVALIDNGTITLPVNFSINESFERAQILVNLTERNITIHFWVDQII